MRVIYKSPRILAEAKQQRDKPFSALRSAENEMEWLASLFENGLGGVRTFGRPTVTRCARKRLLLTHLRALGLLAARLDYQRVFGRVQQLHLHLRLAARRAAPHVRGERWYRRPKPRAG